MMIIINIQCFSTLFISPVTYNEDKLSPDSKGFIDPSKAPQEGEPDFIETNCHWINCNKEYDTQEELVRVSGMFGTRVKILLGAQDEYRLVCIAELLKGDLRFNL